MTPDPDIVALLEPGERIRWQGTPVAGLHRPFRIAGMAVFGIPFLAGGLGAAGFAIWTLTRATEWQMIAIAVFFLIFSLPFIGIGLLLVFGVSLDQLFGAPRRLRYVLTDSRALIISDFPTRKVESYPILKSSPLVHERSKRAGSVYFHVHSMRDSDDHLAIKREGFENIANSSDVFQMMRQMQLGTADTPG